MTWNGWENDRIARIEQRLDELEIRTSGLARLGPREPTVEETEAAAKHVSDVLAAAFDVMEKATPPVDRSNQQLADGSPVPGDRSHTQDRGDGQQKGYVVLAPEERAKGFVRPVRTSYIHVGVGGSEVDPTDMSKSGLKPPGCGTLTSMGLALAETYARDPGFYSGTYCCGCRKHFPLDQFIWDGTNERVGS